MADPVHIFSQGLWHLRDEVACLTGLAPRRAWLRARSGGAIAGWGHKPTAARARAEAQRSGLAYLAFEDGFLRSLRPGPQQKPMSMILDRSGIYYDARQPSDLETMLEIGSFSEDELKTAREIAGEIRQRRLSKYNHGRDRIEGFATGKDQPLVLIIDQTRGDESVAGGLADETSFARMMATAAAENPGALLVAKLHPEVISGTKQGYLRDLAQRHGAQILADDTSPWALLDHAPHVYTVTSQFGFEALLASCKVSTFGTPFYAGWGLTDDHGQASTRRSAKRSLDELTAAVYLRYCKYFDAWRRTPVDAMTAIEQLDFLRRSFLRNDQPVIGFGIARWKRPAVRAMLDGIAGPPQFTGSLARATALARERKATLAAWGPAAARLRQNAATAHLPCLAIEDGFIRSAGLGAAFVAPLSLAFDSRGIYYDPSRSSDIEHILATATITPHDLQRAAALRQRIVADGVTKYNLADETQQVVVPADRDAVLVPGQVADDAAVLAGKAMGADAGENVNATLLAAARARNPGAFVIFKPHPDVEQLGRRGALAGTEEQLGADLVAGSSPIDQLLQQVQRVETYSSLAGFEALLRGLPVTVHGLPFYAGWQVTQDLAKTPRRGRQRSIDELCAAALILYPRYWDPVSGLVCPPEVALDRLAEMRNKTPGVRVFIGKIAGRMVIRWKKSMIFLRGNR